MSSDVKNTGTVVTTVAEPEGHRSVSPMPAQAELEAFYRDTYFQSVPTSAYSHSYSEEELAQRRVRAAMLIHAAAGHRDRARSGAAPVRLFDIGFGEGFELEAGRAAGMQVSGIDYTLDALRRFHPGLEHLVRIGDPLSALASIAGTAERYDVVVLRNVLEHVRDPRGLLKAAGSVTQPGGVIAITVPNDFSDLQADLQARGIVDEEYWVAPPQHLQYFRADRFATFARACGLEMVDLIGDFPIEVFLYHPTSNYVRDPSVGKAAHHARVMLDLLCARYGLERFTAFCRASAAVGLARAFTAFLVHPR
jgi:2-polyprenyl-3-methyl-5-hydroxy-6-metoxy-1,4-benzoquinol methylase